MSTVDKAPFIALCLEGFLYGLYSGIFVMYLQCSKKAGRSGTAVVVFYAVCLLYLLSTATFVGDLVSLIFYMRITTLSLQLQQIESIDSILFRLSIIDIIAMACCDFLAQCILIYRCWIVWGKNIHVTIIPSILAIAYLALWLAGLDNLILFQDQPGAAGWGPGAITSTTALVASIAVNALMTSLIVFKILKVFLEVNPDLVELTTGGTKLRHIIFVIIESGMALFVIQLIRLAFFIMAAPWTLYATPYVVAIQQMFNGIAPTIILVRVSMSLSFNDPESFKEAVGSLRLNNPSSDPNSTSSMPPQLVLGSLGLAVTGWPGEE